MILDIFTKPETVTCVLCRARVSIKKGDKARFFNHISHDHEVRTPQRGFDVTSSLNVKISVNSTMDIQPHGASDVETHDSRAQLAPSRQEKWKMPGDKRFEIWIVNGPIPVVIPEPVKP